VIPFHCAHFNTIGAQLTLVMSNGRIGWVGYVACMGRKRNAYKMLVEKCQGRPRHRWENNIKMDLVKIVWEVVDWIHLT